MKKIAKKSLKLGKLDSQNKKIQFSIKELSPIFRNENCSEKKTASQKNKCVKKFKRIP